MKELKLLLTTRKIIALSLTIVACGLWAMGTIDIKDAFLMVLGYYFGKSTALDKPGEDS